MKKNSNKFFICLIVLIVLINICVLSFFKFTRQIIIDGKSMNPFFNNNDKILVTNITNNLKRGDIIVTNYKNQQIIKRIVGLPSEHIIIKDNNIYINNELLQENYIQNTSYNNFRCNSIDLKLKEDEYFILGDNRNHSTDSRVFGPIKKKDILYKELFILKKVDK